MDKKSYIRGNREKSIMAIAILENIDYLIAPKLFRILGAPILFLPTIAYIHIIYYLLIRLLRTNHFANFSIKTFKQSKF